MQEIMSHVEGLPETTYQKGDVIYEEGKSGARVYILKEGSVVVTAFGNELCRLNTPGTILGEVSVLLEDDYSATVTAVADTTFYVVDDLFLLFKDKPEICMKVARLLALPIPSLIPHCGSNSPTLASQKIGFHANLIPRGLALLFTHKYVMASSGNNLTRFRKFLVVYYDRHRVRTLD